MLSANPKGTEPLRLDEERREIEAGLIERSRLRDQFRLIVKTAVRPRDFRRAMLDHSPQVVHFSGHGGGEAGLVLEDETGQPKLVQAAALAELFKLYADSLHCVVLSACYSEVQARAIAKHIPYVIGMSGKIKDRAAIEFAVAFYDALGAGRDMEFAYKHGCVAIPMAGILQSDIPVLHQKSRANTTPVQTKPQKLQTMSSLTHNLTENQIRSLRWFIEEARSSRLQEEEISIVWTFDGNPIVGYQGTVPEIHKLTLEALEKDGCIVFEKRDREYKFALTRRAYEVIDFASAPASPT